MSYFFAEILFSMAIEVLTMEFQYYRTRSSKRPGLLSMESGKKEGKADTRRWALSEILGSAHQARKQTKSW